jgi:hypothetical protein
MKKPPKCRVCTPGHRCTVVTHRGSSVTVYCRVCRRAMTELDLMAHERDAARAAKSKATSTKLVIASRGDPSKKPKKMTSFLTAAAKLDDTSAKCACG